MKKIIFEYKNSSCLQYYGSETGVKVYEEDGKTFADCYSMLPELGDEQLELSVDISDQLERLKDVKELEFPPVLDGSINEIIFLDGDELHSKRASNLWYFKDADEDLYPNGIMLYSIFKSICRRLIKAGVRKDYLKA